MPAVRPDDADGRMSPIKLALRRFAILLLRKLVDAADHRLHAVEVKLRNDLGVRKPCSGSVGSDLARPAKPARTTLTIGLDGHQAVPKKSASPSAVKMAANLKVSGMSIADASSAMRNLGFSAKEVSAVFS